MKPNENNALSYTALALLWGKQDKMRFEMNLDGGVKGGCV